MSLPNTHHRVQVFKTDFYILAQMNEPDSSKTKMYHCYYRITETFRGFSPICFILIGHLKQRKSKIKKSRDDFQTWTLKRLCLKKKKKDSVAI